MFFNVYPSFFTLAHKAYLYRDIVRGSATQKVRLLLVLKMGTLRALGYNSMHIVRDPGTKNVVTKEWVP